MIPCHGLNENNDQPPGSIIEKDSLIQVPIWLATCLLENEIISIVSAPKAFSSKIQADLDADPQNVNLKELTLYYYILGIKLSINPMFRLKIMNNVYNPQLMVLKAFSGRLFKIAQALWRPLTERNYLEKSAPFAPIGGDLFINKLEFIERKCI